jgi:hypothetical protein
MLFGATVCPCGYGHNPAGHRLRSPSSGVSYWEALRAYWRIYWPPQLFGIALVFNPNFLGVYSIPPVVLFAALILFPSAALFLLVPRLVSGPHRGFSLVVVATPIGETGRHLGLDQRARVWLFLWWRHLAASLVACFLAFRLSEKVADLLAGSDLNMLEALGAAGGVLIVVPILANLFIIGPVIVKMLVGNPFPDFSIEARRAPGPAGMVS